MLNQISTIRHSASGVSLQTPLLVPSFSSKGFARSKEDGRSEIRKILAASSEFLTEAYLISAYDVHYGHIPAPLDLPSTPELLFLDSGGYEVSTDRDYSAVLDALPAPDPWDRKKWESVVSSCRADLPLVVVSYDHHQERAPFLDQVKLAREGFRHCRDHLHTFLLKPETDSQMTLERALKAAGADTEQLGSFDIIGVTEKELGSSMLDRMVSIANLRLAMNAADIKAPIHVFGALDPLSVCLYFISGAEIFDGLTWIRYAYQDGRCIYTHNHGVLTYGIHLREDAIKSRTLADNYYCLYDLQQRLKEFSVTRNFEKLGPHAKLLSEAWDSLKTRLGRRL